jgi:poly(3-hydroxybutyrate) depolymerase
VAVITIIDGEHNWAGAGGNHAPCPNQNRDIDASVEILQFWRAHAGLRNPSP